MSKQKKTGEQPDSTDSGPYRAWHDSLLKLGWNAGLNEPEPGAVPYDPSKSYIEETMRAVQAWRILHLCGPGLKEERRAAGAAGGLSMAMVRFDSVITWLRTQAKDGLAESVIEKATELFELCGYPEGYAPRLGVSARSSWHPRVNKNGRAASPARADREFDRAHHLLFTLSLDFVNELDRIRKMVGGSELARDGSGLPRPGDVEAPIATQTPPAKPEAIAESVEYFYGLLLDNVKAVDDQLQRLKPHLPTAKYRAASVRCALQSVPCDGLAGPRKPLAGILPGPVKAKEVLHWVWEAAGVMTSDIRVACTWLAELMPAVEAWANGDSAASADLVARWHRASDRLAKGVKEALALPEPVATLPALVAQASGPSRPGDVKRTATPEEMAFLNAAREILNAPRDPWPPPTVAAQLIELGERRQPGFANRVQKEMFWQRAEPLGPMPTVQEPSQDDGSLIQRLNKNSPNPGDPKELYVVWEMLKRLLAVGAPEPQAEKPEPDKTAPVSCAQIAEILGLGKDRHGAIQQRLRRFREQHADGWVETNQPAKNKAHFLYEWGRVKSYVQGVQSVPLASHSQE